MAFLGINLGKIFGGKAGKSVAAFALSEADKVVAALKATDIGKAVADDIKTFSTHNLSGAEKFAAVLGNTIPLVLRYAASGGIAAVAKDAEDIARALVQQVFNDTKSTTAGAFASQLLKLLGIK